MSEWVNTANKAIKQLLLAEPDRILFISMCFYRSSPIRNNAFQSRMNTCCLDHLHSQPNHALYVYVFQMVTPKKQYLILLDAFFLGEQE